MAMSLSASIAIKEAAQQALSNTPASLLQPYLPKGPIQARSAGAIAYMKQSNKMADLCAIVMLCNTLETLLGDPKQMASLVDQNNASTMTANATPLDAAQADWNKADNAEYLAAIQREAGISLKVDQADNARRVGGDALQKAADDGRKAARAASLDDFVAKRHEAAGTKPTTPAPHAGHSPTNPTTFGRI